MSATLEQIAAELAEVKGMLQRLLTSAPPAEPPVSTIKEEARMIEETGIDPVEYFLGKYGVSGKRGRPAKKDKAKPPAKRKTKQKEDARCTSAR